VLFRSMFRALPRFSTLLIAFALPLAAWAAAPDAKPAAIGITVTTKSVKARHYFEQGLAKQQTLHIQDGLENMRKAVAADPKFALAHVLLSTFSQDPIEQVSELEKAVATKKYASREEQLVVDWFSNSGRGQWIPAIQAMNSALEQWPNHRELQWLAGTWLTGQQQWARAIPVYQRTLKLDPDFADAWNSLAYCYAHTRQFDKAFAAMRKYTELLPAEPNPQDSFAEISRMAGQFDEALAHYRASLTLDSTFIESQVGLGDTYAVMGNQERARVEYAVAVSKADANDTARSILWSMQVAATYVREGDFDRADAAFLAQAELAHENGFGNLEAQAYRSMAMYQKDGKKAGECLAKAEAALDEKHKVSKEFVDQERAVILRTRVYRAFQDGDLAAAGAALEQLRQLADSSNDGNVALNFHSAQGALLLAQGKPEEAIPLLEEDDHNPYAMKGLVTAYEKTGKKADAERIAKDLAGFNEPVMEQALVVPQFRKDRVAQKDDLRPSGTPNGRIL
jgi:tetratricopeptide (TPR) repeat protein